MEGKTRRDLLLAALTVGAAVAFQVDDITDLLTASPKGMAQPMSYRQGVIRAFDKTTLENTVEVGGSLVTNLPVLGVAEAASLSTGSVVGLMVVGSTWAIIGRLVQPGTADATDAITQVSQQTRTETVAASESTSSGAYGDLATPGPSVDVIVRASGRCLVTVGAEIQAVAVGGSVIETGSGFMSFEVTGATVVSANDSRAAQLWVAYDSPSTFATTINTRAGISRTTMLEGLNPGAHTFKAVYKRNGSSAATFLERNITVLAL